MDPVTHMIVGAGIGQAVAGRSLGFGRAALWGAIAAELPDIDVVVSALAANDPLDMLVRHRGVTHALWFAPVTGLIAGFMMATLGTGPRTSPWRWVLLLTAALLSHPLVDVCTHYGTQLLSPFSDRRFALPALPIIEPVFTLLLACGAAGAGWLAHRGRPGKAVACAVAGLALGAAYLSYGLALNSAAVDFARKDLAQRGVPIAAVQAFPTILQLHYRRVVARTAAEDWVGFVSAAKPCPIVWSNRTRDDGEAAFTLRATQEGRIFEWFADGLTAAYHDGERVYLTDLRYGFSGDVLDGIWRLEASIGAAERSLGTPRFIESTRPAASPGNVLQLLRVAYPANCDEGALPPRFASTD